MVLEKEQKTLCLRNPTTRKPHPQEIEVGETHQYKQRRGHNREYDDVLQKAMRNHPRYFTALK
jgi:hypothetical protein